MVADEGPVRLRTRFLLAGAVEFVSPFTAGMPTVTGNFHLVGSGVLTEFAAIFFSGGSYTHARWMSAFTRF